ncbi:hypothetical protein HMPREF0591_0294 [Mycobacterium parascrofulaceum ATCC BAA-614]|uniref:Uncharacterized protein n=1 Tax=Mycobacterium parascrofulaceum ATCC BAA-614 TaxID=525368 RepID=D5P2A0_9MYCO|nr:hypothetical protein HMPREF0591_0294 [Mycobacterium parascrofulaceum ATCC BAA-614]
MAPVGHIFATYAPELNIDTSQYHYVLTFGAACMQSLGWAGKQIAAASRAAPASAATARRPSSAGQREAPGH